MLLSCVLNDDDRRQGVQPNTFARGRLFGDGKKVATTCIGEVVEALSLASTFKNWKNENVVKLCHYTRIVIIIKKFNFYFDSFSSY